jgi:hypothetical protein
MLLPFVFVGKPFSTQAAMVLQLKFNQLGVYHSTKFYPTNQQTHIAAENSTLLSLWISDPL